MRNASLHMRRPGHSVEDVGRLVCSVCVGLSEVLQLFSQKLAFRSGGAEDRVVDRGDDAYGAIDECSALWRHLEPPRPGVGQVCAADEQAALLEAGEQIEASMRSAPVRSAACCWVGPVLFSLPSQLVEASRLNCVREGEVGKAGV